MSINNAMNTGLSGLGAEGQAIGILGDNVANANTVGFKASRAIFEDVLGGAMGSRDAVGGGVRMVRTQQLFAQGSFLSTGQPTDLALAGDGFFVVHGALNGLVSDFYTRAGQTTLAQDGTLVNPDGLAIQGYKVNADGTFGPAIGSVQVPTAALPPKPTSKVSLTANLDATATPPALAWDPQNPAATSNFGTTTTSYDSLGNAHATSVYLVNTGPGTWDYHALANGAEVTGGTPGQNFEFAGGTLTFTTGGALATSALTSGGTVDYTGATPGQAVNLDFGKPIASGGTGLDGTTQFGAPSSVSAQSQDGYSSGSFTGVQVDSTGVVRGTYDNGQKISMAQLAVAKFRSDDGLSRAGNNLWAASRDSGDASLGAAGAGGRPAVVSGALEQSNVDISTQFVDLISHQRAFQANSKTITTVDEMMQTVLGMKQ
jgi:flagellar hook protein FlgE